MDAHHLAPLWSQHAAGLEGARALD